MSDATEILKTESRETIERWCREKVQVGQSKHGVLCRVLGTYLMLVPEEDLSVSPHLQLNGCWESWISMVVAMNVAPGMTCVDVGANCGYYTLLLHDLVGPKGRVIACEPQLALAAMIERNLGLNGYHGSVCSVAVSDHSGKGMLMTYPDNLGNAYVTEPVPFYDGALVACERLDDLVPDGVVDFVKIDAEGHEAKIWEGMQAVIARSPKIQILMEYNPEEDEGRVLIERILREGFVIREVLSSGKLSEPRTALDLYRAPEAGFWMLWIERRTG